MARITRKFIDRLGAMMYALLVLWIPLAMAEHEMRFTIRDSLPLTVLVVMGQVVGVLLYVYCLVFFLNHLLRRNKRVSWLGQTVWLFLILFGGLLTMPLNGIYIWCACASPIHRAIFLGQGMHPGQ